jgi:hypothetical protein
MEQFFLGINDYFLLGYSLAMLGVSAGEDPLLFAAV